MPPQLCQGATLASSETVLDAVFMPAFGERIIGFLSDTSDVAFLSFELNNERNEGFVRAL